MKWQTGDEVYDFASKYRKLRISNRFEIEFGLELRSGLGLAYVL